MESVEDIGKTSKAIVRIAEEGARALVATLSPPLIAKVLATGTASDRAHALALVPAERLPAILALDPAVFDPAPHLSREQPQGHIETLTPKEAGRLLANATTSSLVVETDWDPLGFPIAWGLHPWQERFCADEALERLDAVLESGNPDEWKVAALAAVPNAYWALALRAIGDDRRAFEARLDAIEAIDGPCAVSVSELLGLREEDLILQVMEARDERLEAAQEAIAVGPTGVEVLDRLAERRSARDLLEGLRGEKG